MIGPIATWRLNALFSIAYAVGSSAGSTSSGRRVLRAGE